MMTDSVNGRNSGSVGRTNFKWAIGNGELGRAWAGGEGVIDGLKANVGGGRAVVVADRWWR